MKERPILFSAPMVRAILSGRKTQTRRIMKPQPIIRDAVLDRPYFREQHPCVREENWNRWGMGGPDPTKYIYVDCPYGKPGDRLWVRETWYSDDPPHNECIYYRADGDQCEGFAHETFVPPWKPSIHMPRKLSRIDLLIKKMRAERLQEMSNDDVFAEGIAIQDYESFEPHDDFARLWESINGDGSYKKNPWVWVIEFERVRP